MTKKGRAATRSRAPAISEILRDLEARAPSETAEKWDNVGLLVGDANATTKGAIVSIDLTEESIEAAKRLGYGLIVNHHPCIFPRQKGLARITASGPSRLAHAAARAGIAVVAAHTNFDRCALEVPDRVSRALGFAPIGRLFDEEDVPLVKLAVFVPASHADRVREAVCAAGAGRIGRYESCAFGALGEGTFRGGTGTRPFLGKPGRLERAKEVRLETILPRGLKKRVLEAMREAHPYEEVAYDLYRVEQDVGALGLVSGLGYGVYGDLPKPVAFGEVARRVKRAFGIEGFLATDPEPKAVKRIGFVAGKGASFAGSASSVGCDLFITGEAGYHVAREAASRGLALMEIGHRESEIFFLRAAEGWCREWGIDAKVLNTKVQSYRSA